MVLRDTTEAPPAIRATPDAEAQQEQRRRHAYAEAILRAASENGALIRMARESARLVETQGTDTWPTLDEVEQALGHDG